MRSHIEHDGRLITYLDAAGFRPSPAPRTVVLLHAFPLAAEMWRPQLDAVPTGWRFVAPDLRGFGQSTPGDASAPPSVDDYAHDLVALLDALGLDRVVVGGLSMGGYAAFALLRLARERVAGLVLADTKSEPDGEGARADRDAMLERLERGGVEAVLDRMLLGLLGRTTRDSRPGVVETVRHMVLEQHPAGVAAGVRRLKSRPDSTPLLTGITVPALVVGGDEDQITGPDAMRRIHAGIPGADLAIIPRAGHLSNLEAPADFNAALVRFLETRF
jgi:3-oxoadipate enol-lactonase